MQDRFESALKERAASFILPVEPNTVAHIEPLHGPAQIGSRRLNLQVIVVGHQHITVHPHPKTLGQAGNEPAKVLVSRCISKNHSLFYPAIEDMVPSSFNIQSSRPCHLLQLSPLVAVTSRLICCLLSLAPEINFPYPIFPFLLGVWHDFGTRPNNQATTIFPPSFTVQPPPLPTK